MATALGPAGLRRVIPATLLNWAVLGVCVLATYLVIVVGGMALVGGSGSARVPLALVATVVVAVALEPTRRRIGSVASRLFAAPVTEPYEVLSSFAERLGDTASVEEMTRRLARVLAEGTAADWTQVWLEVRDELRLVASWPPGTITDPTPPSMAGEHRGAVHSVPVGHGEGILGVLRVRERDGRPMTAVESRLFAGLAGQAGLLLAKAQLRAELQARVDELDARARELRSARADLVTASDVERRRLERNLHDGAQQELVALSINLGLARTLLVTDPRAASEVLISQADAAEAAIETLATLSRGLGPSALMSDGLEQALRGLAAAAPIWTRVDLDAVPRYSVEIESALYYCASEALQNAVKHSGGSVVELSLRASPTGVELTVADDGRGLPSGGRPTPVSNDGAASRGTGLRGMRERAAAVGGVLRIDSRPGGGTVVTIRVRTADDTGARG